MQIDLPITSGYCVRLGVNEVWDLECRDVFWGGWKCGWEQGDGGVGGVWVWLRSLGPSQTLASRNTSAFLPWPSSPFTAGFSLVPIFRYLYI
ncbi:hypothetical protein D9758_018320 [Tetrapyrgos nigripes]|uniref:Uncharacterized protein n=1 Tax=Tetrapyrgos nigripes TaxID=182062 RepID=A0A8H5F1F9_9AGAR|nr:hypothetical protein D9758_018320 [Tetrapyrgos nigripes]